jgi:photosystem II stability/assembly factor-like uncharacterized protein
MTETVLMIGTRKGLWVARSRDRHVWDVDGPDDVMGEVHAVAIDKRLAEEGEAPRLLMANRHWHIGPQVMHSDDLGQSWKAAASGGVAFPEDTGATVEAIWSLAPSASEPDVVYAGTEPSALWRSTDRGETFALVRGLWDHPHRPQWEPGGGGQAIHTLLPHPTDTERMSVAMSTGGVYRSRDAGATWEPSNKGIKAEFMPDEVSYPEWGQCVHKVARSATEHDVLYAQNHGGVYRSDDEGDSWTSIAEGLPAEFGFPVVTHPRVDGTLWLFPLESSYRRFPPDRACRVWRSTDRGATWQEQGKGLPDRGFFAGVMRDAMCVDDADPVGVYIGSRDGSVYASADEGESWAPVAEHLPDILCVRAATV